MKQRDRAKSTVSLGAAALIGITAPACCQQKPAPTTTPAPASAPAATPPAATPPAPAATPPAAAAPAATAPAATAPAATTPPGKPDCSGADQFTEACGYASPTRYAVLDPASIVNA